MRIGVILSLTEVCKGAGAGETAVALAPASVGTFLPGFSCIMLDILGRSILDRTLDRVTAATDTQPTVIIENLTIAGLFPCDDITASGSNPAWENAIGRHIMRGVDHLLLIRLNAYTDLDFGELLQSHTETQSSVTRVYGPTGALDIAVVDANLLQDPGNTYCKTLSEIIFRQRRFLYRGYLNPLAGPRHLRRLAEDGLHGVCGLKPIGIEVRPQIWYGAGARVHNSAIIQAPAFVGMGSYISASCTIDRASAIEHNCVVDYRSTIRQSCVLQNTHIGIDLNVRHAIVFNKRLIHLDRGVEINCDPRLIGVTSRSGALPWNLAASLRRRQVFQESVTPAQTKLPAPVSVSGMVAREPKVA
jgi:hypothetical protein